MIVIQPVIYATNAWTWLHLYAALPIFWSANWIFDSIQSDTPIDNAPYKQKLHRSAKWTIDFLDTRSAVQGNFLRISTTLILSHENSTKYLKVIETASKAAVVRRLHNCSWLDLGWKQITSDRYAIRSMTILPYSFGEVIASLGRGSLQFKVHFKWHNIMERCSMFALSYRRQRVNSVVLTQQVNDSKWLGNVHAIRLKKLVFFQQQQ